MKDFLAYRIPGKEVKKKVGEFKIQLPPYHNEGFVVADFHQREVCYFDGLDLNDASIPNLHALETVPYVVSKKEYLIGAETLLNSFHLFGVEKAVYSRVKSLYFDEKKTLQLFDALVEKYPSAFVYLISSKLMGTWVGASPELLLSMHGKQGYTMSLAGTKRKLQLTEDWTEKEKIEQNFVTEYIEKTLYLMDLEEIEAHGPFDVEAGPVSHLRTDFSFSSPKSLAMEIATKLHPTPAVAGVPTKEAVDLIQSVEHNSRKLYTGFLGEIGPVHNYLYVNLRCCQIQKGKAYLYLGGGYTKQSIPEEEWFETENKAKTLGDIIQNITGK